MMAAAVVVLVVTMMAAAVGSQVAGRAEAWTHATDTKSRSRPETKDLDRHRFVAGGMFCCVSKQAQVQAPVCVLF